MKLLLDSHALIWAVEAPNRLSLQAQTCLLDRTHDLVVSTATVWELSIKVGLGKLSLSRPFDHWIEEAITGLGASQLPITIRHAATQSRLPWHHRDPFDRMLVAQAMAEGIEIASADEVLDSYGIARLW